MEHGSLQDPSKATFSFVDEDHSLANVVRFGLNQDDPAREVLKDACQYLMKMCQHVRNTSDKAVTDFKSSNSSKMERE